MARNKNRNKKPSHGPQGRQAEQAVPARTDRPSVIEVADLAVDVWKVAERARSLAQGERVLAACERAEDRLKRMGFEMDGMVGKPYDTNLKVRVVDHDEGEGPTVIAQCITPAVFYRDELVREAEVVTRGRKENS